jgi:hypothetical protein
MRRALIALAALALPLPALAGPVAVTRFHTPETLAMLNRVAVVVVAAPGTGPAGLEGQVWRSAVERELADAGFGAATPGAADVIAEVQVERQDFKPERRRGPVSVGVGGSTGGWNSGVGLGLGFNLGGGPKEVFETRLSVVIRSRVTGKSLWEGRAESTDKAKARDAAPAFAALRMAHALFSGFPGKSGATIEVK